MSRITHFILILAIYRMKARARKLARKTGADHYIIIWRGKPEILSRDGFRYMRQRDVFPLSFTVKELKEMAIYHAKAKR
jgi:hypothetical protein